MDKKIEVAIRETLVIGNPVSLKRCVDKLKLIFEQEQALRQANVSGSLEFEKPQMNIAALEAKMKKFFDTVSTDELIERFEKLGYEFEPIDGQANDH